MPSPAAGRATLRFPRRRGAVPSLVLRAVLGLCVLAAGCSRSEEDQPLPEVSATTPVLSQRDYITRANAICVEADKRITALTNKSGPVNNNGGAASRTELQQLVDQITPIGQNAIDQLKSLTPPPEDAAAIRDGIARMQRTLDQAHADPTGPIDPIGQGDLELYSYGLTSCFSNPTG